MASGCDGRTDGRTHHSCRPCLRIARTMRPRRPTKVAGGTQTPTISRVNGGALMSTRHDLVNVRDLAEPSGLLRMQHQRSPALLATPTSVGVDFLSTHCSRLRVRTL